jgi:dihydroorotase/N-acyl-D-amino-acid deacylase
MRSPFLTCFAALPLAGLLLGCGPDEEPFDVLVVGGHLVDGSGEPSRDEDLALRGDRIVARGELAGSPARRVIDASDLVVAPGFIDMLGHSGLPLLVEPNAEGKIRQGITTEITGEGRSPAPQNARTRADLESFAARFDIELDWSDFEGYFSRLERQGIALNLASYVGATQVRDVVLGRERRSPSPAELARMQQLVKDAMQQGALGLSSALVYAPARYARTEELVTLARVAADHGGIYATHMRGEGRGIFRALDETFTIAREARVPVEIFHLKTAGPEMRGRMGEVVARIEEARSAGLDVRADQYPYVAAHTALSACLPPWAHAGGSEALLERLRDPATRARLRREISEPGADWDNFCWMAGGAEGVLVSSVNRPDLEPYAGLRLAALAQIWGKDPLDALFDLLVADAASTTAIFFVTSEEDVKVALVQPWVSIATDYSGLGTDGPLASGAPHPRAYGTFPRILGRYVREARLLRLEEAVRKMSSLAAEHVTLRDRGLLRPGFYADVVIFDPDLVSDRATFDEPRRYSTGVEYVLVNGEVVLDQGRMTGALPGRVLRGPGWRPELALAERGEPSEPVCRNPRDRAPSRRRDAGLLGADLVGHDLPGSTRPRRGRHRWPGRVRHVRVVEARASPRGRHDVGYDQHELHAPRARRIRTRAAPRNLESARDAGRGRTRRHLPRLRGSIAGARLDQSGAGPGDAPVRLR